MENQAVDITLYQSIFESSLEAILVVDIQGNILMTNPSYEHMLGYNSGELINAKNIGHSIYDITILSQKQISKIKEDIQKTLQGNNLVFEVEYMNKIYSATSIPLHTSHNPAPKILFVYTNISKQKRAQQELTNALKLEQEVNELKSRFISMASHEFRTPLSAILSSAILIGKQNEPGMEERREKHVARIRTNVKNLVVILNDFLSLGKLEEGKIKVKPQYFELVQFTKLLIEEMESSKKNGQIIIFEHNNKVINTYLDPKLLSHILINILSNSIKYSGENTKILFNLNQKKEYLSLEVIDEGIGIPEDEQKNLFERFYRANNATNIQGTGLGLHIVKQYIELMGGTISFTSKVNIGTSFIIHLPLNLKENEKNTTN